MNINNLLTEGLYWKISNRGLAIGRLLRPDIVHFHFTHLRTEIFLPELKPVFHFKRTVPKRIKNDFKFQNFVNVDWLVFP